MEKESSSFRDPSGLVFYVGKGVYRQINMSYRTDYDALINSGLYEDLHESGMIVGHDEVIPPAGTGSNPYKVIKPEKIPFISYPYEWSFSQLKDAALLTLALQKKALEKNMSLKDASAYNIQFNGCNPVLIDTLSFEVYKEGEPWVAYGQFCRHFLAPLCLMSKSDIRLVQLMKTYIDGIPLDLASRLLKPRTYLIPGILAHIHLHAKAQGRYGSTAVKKNSGMGVSKFALQGIIESLESTVRALSWKPVGTEWADYYNDTNYSEKSFAEKKNIVSMMLDKSGAGIVWDLGANTGVFSRLASGKGAYTVGFDIDPAAVEKNYIDAKHEKNLKILPLVMDLNNPSPAVGWENTERKNLSQRGPADCAMALALIHHLAISNNLPLYNIGSYLAASARFLIIEFIPKSDSQVQRLLSSRVDIFTSYDMQNFEKEFAKHFEIKDKAEISGSERAVYLMRSKMVA